MIPCFYDGAVGSIGKIQNAVIARPCEAIPIVEATRVALRPFSSRFGIASLTKLRSQ